MRSRATALRYRLTEPERRLWWHLRHSLGAADAHFRRQVAIGSYVVDFCSLAYRIVIEVDGNQHGTDEGRRHDASRDTELGRTGFRTLRFTNREVMTETQSVLDTILAALEHPRPIPDRSPQRGGQERAERDGAPA
jgi:very-short-patch-repair endonuclease